MAAASPVKALTSTVRLVPWRSKCPVRRLQRTRQAPTTIVHARAVVFHGAHRQAGADDGGGGCSRDRLFAHLHLSCAISTGWRVHGWGGGERTGRERGMETAVKAEQGGEVRAMAVGKCPVVGQPH